MRALKQCLQFPQRDKFNSQYPSSSRPDDEDADYGDCGTGRHRWPIKRTPIDVRFVRGGGGVNGLVAGAVMMVGH